MSPSKKHRDETDVTARLIALIKDLSEQEQQELLNDLEERILKGKRQHERKPFFMVVDYSSNDRVFQDYIQDISVGGVFIETRMPFSIGQEISLTFPLPNYQKSIKIGGVIVRTDSNGVGVEFKIADEDQKDLIKKLIEMI